MKKTKERRVQGSVRDRWHTQMHEKKEEGFKASGVKLVLKGTLEVTSIEKSKKEGFRVDCWRVTGGCADGTAREITDTSLIRTCM